MSKFSDFFRNASPEEREAIYRQVAERATARQQELMTKAKSKAIAARGRQAILDAEPEVNFDLERMQRAVAGPFVTVPDGLTREEFVEWMHSQAKHASGDLT